MKKIKLGFLTVHGDTENHSQMMNGVFEAANINNANVIRFATKYYAEDLSRYNLELNILYKIIESQDLDGLMFLGWMPGLVGKYFEDFLKRFDSMPMVSLGTNYENIPNVYADPEICITDLLEHMIKVHGYKRIVFVPPSSPDIRAAVYIEEMQKYGLYREELCITNNDLCDLLFEDRMKRVLAILMDERKVKFDAILVMFDTDAQNLLKELKLRDINVPADLAIASYEDTEFANYCMPPLTTITYPWREVGYRGCEKIIRLIQHNKIEYSVGIASKLIIRNSCGCSFSSIKLSKVEGKIQANHFVAKVDYKFMLQFSYRINDAFPSSQVNVEKLLNALVTDFAENTSTCFFNEFVGQLQMIIVRNPYLDSIDDIEEVIYYIRNMVVTYIANDSRLLVLFEDIILKTQITIKEKAISIIGFGNIQLKDINRELHNVSQSLISTFNTKTMLDVLDNNLHKLQIPSCYIFLFAQGSYEKCTLIFRYVNGMRVAIENSHVRLGYISDTILETHQKVLCQLLNIGSEYIGVIVFEPLFIDERIYRTLALHISSALKGALLLENLKEEISLRKEKEMLLMHLANHDPLTDLFNRRHFNKTIQNIISHSVEHPNEEVRFFLIFIDFDDFKQVNDKYGHDVGDLQIIEIAKRLKTFMSKYPYLIPDEEKDGSNIDMKEAVFRLGGDEFTAIAAGLSNEQMKNAASELINTMKASYFIDGQEILITCSIGISIYPDDADSAEMIVKYADTAMYRAKTVKSMFYFYGKKE